MPNYVKNILSFDGDPGSVKNFSHFSLQTLS